MPLVVLHKLCEVLNVDQATQFIVVKDVQHLDYHGLGVVALRRKWVRILYYVGLLTFSLRKSILSVNRIVTVVIPAKLFIIDQNSIETLFLGRFERT